MKTKLALLFALCFLGCEPPPNVVLKFKVGQKVKMAVDGRPAIVVDISHGEYIVKFFTNEGEYTSDRVDEFELVEE